MISANAIIKVAKKVLSLGSTDTERASMTLLKASSDLSQATMIHIFEAAQKDIIRELSRLTNEDLVKYHTEAALQRVDGILDNLKTKAQKEATASVKANLISGRIASRQKSGQKELVSAFDLQSADQERVQRLVDQMCGNIFMAADATSKGIKQQVQAACVKAQTSKEIPKEALIQVTFPTIEGQKQKQVTINLEPEEQISKKLQDQLDKDPVKAAKEIARQAYQRIQFFRNNYVVGRREADTVRQETLRAVAKNEAKGGGYYNAQKDLITNLMNNGITAFVDKSGRRWSLNNYCNMAVRTTAKQSSNLGELFDDPEHDLYMVVDQHSTCPICSKFEGRVYSRSGTNPYYPPLSTAFGKINKLSGNDLSNTYLNIHPNCRHTLVKYIERAHSPKEIEKMRKVSNESFEVDRRTKAEVDAYKERERIKALEQESIRRYRQFMQYIPVKELGAWPTFHKHYVSKDDRYLELEKRYEEAKKASE